MKFSVFAVFIALVCGIEGGNIPLEIVIRLLGHGGYYAVHTDQYKKPYNYEFVMNADGYKYAYQVGYRFNADSSGELKKVQGTKDAIVVKGNYAYVTPDGTYVKVRYVADENGYRPVVRFDV